MTPAATNRWVA